MDATQLWQTAQGDLQVQMTRGMYDTWLRNTEAVSLDDGVLTVAVRTSFVKDWLEKRLLDTVERAVTAIAGEDISLQFTVMPNSRVGAEERNLLTMADPQEPAPPPRRPSNARRGSELNARYRFDNFIVGPNNRMAHAASQAVAEHPATAYNPLFIYGGVGLGKTHLLNATGHVPQANGYTVLYVSSEEFTNDLINSIRNKTTNQFRDKYRSIDVLLIDDIQFIAGKDQTQEEFFHTFNTLHTANKQIILSSDRPPKAIPTLEERLRSRFEWGLTVDIQPPDLETRTAILRAKADELGIAVPATVIDLVAAKVQSNIRELEGALNRVLAQAKLFSTPLTEELAVNVLQELLGAPVSVDLPEIVDAVCKHFRLSPQAIYGRSRRADIALPRQIVMYLARTEMNASLPQIGEAIGGRDHTTVLYAHDKIADLVESDQSVRRDVNAIREALRSKRS